jgi:hypothetical protein
MEPIVHLYFFTSAASWAFHTHLTLTSHLQPARLNSLLQWHRWSQTSLMSSHLFSTLGPRLMIQGLALPLFLCRASPVSASQTSNPVKHARVASTALRPRSGAACLQSLASQCFGTSIFQSNAYSIHHHTWTPQFRYLSSLVSSPREFQSTQIYMHCITRPLPRSSQFLCLASVVGASRHLQPTQIHAHLVTPPGLAPSQPLC